jgi:hypothetical protein
MVAFKQVEDSDCQAVYVRGGGKHIFQIIKLMYLDEWDSTMDQVYNCALSVVELFSIPDSTVEQALNSFSMSKETWKAMKERDKATLLAEYGAKAPIWERSGNNRKALMKEAREEAAQLDDPESYESAMRETCNKIGSTAREMMQGDIFSGMTRGIVNGDETSRLMGKLYGISEEKMDAAKASARPPAMIGPFVETFSAQVDLVKAQGAMDDPLPYYMGLQDAMAGRPSESHPDLSSNYHKGYQHGLEVKLGNAKMPDWIITR